MNFFGMEKVKKFIEANPKRILILRGLPGSGKSTLIKEVKSWSDSGEYDPYVCSSDAFFEDKDGNYFFDSKLLPINHAKCFQKYIEAVRLLGASNAIAPPSNTIIVDNTNTVVNDLVPYCRVAEAYNIPFVIVEVMCDPKDSYNRNVHEVPMEVIYGMYRNLIVDQVPGYWPRIMVKSQTSEEDLQERLIDDLKNFAYLRDEYCPEGRADSGVIDD